MQDAPGDLREQIVRYIESEADKMKHHMQRAKARAYRMLAQDIRARFDERDMG